MNINKQSNGAARWALGAVSVAALSMTSQGATAAPAAAASATLGRVNVAGVSVARLKPAAAQQRVARVLASKLEAGVALSDGRRIVYRRRRDLGLRLDVAGMVARAESGQRYVPLAFLVEPQLLQRALRRMAPGFQSAAHSARVTQVRGRVRIVPEVAARELNVGAATVRVMQQLKSNPRARLLKVPVTTKKPVLTAARLKGINGRLASFTTRFNPGKEKRTLNMRLAIAQINGRLLSPGEVFSLNGTVGERTQARGYRTAIIFKNGYKVAGIGGGVSQVTGTLFNAALLAGLPIVTYRTHSRPVAYIPIGRDATVAYGAFDMKFKNNTSAPIYISYQIGRNTTTATLYGRKTPGQKVSVTVRAQSQGPRHRTAQLYRTIRRGGKLIKERVGTSTYDWNADMPD